MSYFRSKLRDFTRDYGHFTGTLLFNTLYSLKKQNGFQAVGNILSCKSKVAEILSHLDSIRKHIELIDNITGSNQLLIIDRLRNILRNETLSVLDLIMKHTIRKDYDSASKLLQKMETQLTKYRDDAMALVNLKESFDISKLPLDYVEFFETGKMRFIGRIFISYSMKNKNEQFIEDLVAPFLEELGFQTIYAKRDFPPTRTPGQSAEEFIKKCSTLIAFLTKDQDSHPSANVIHEIGVASDKTVLMFVEKGTKVPTNLATSRTYFVFERQHLEELLLELLRRLRLSDIFKPPRLY